MALLIALLPAVFWGATGIVTTKAGGTAGQGTLGMTMGSLIFGMATLVFYVLPHAGSAYMMNPRIWIGGIISGLFWAVGTSYQFQSFKKIGVSIGQSVSTAGQIVTNALMAAIALGEWHTGKMWLWGLVSIVVVVIGAVLIAMPDQSHMMINRSDFISGLISLAISTVGFMMYFVFPNLLNKIGYISNGVHSAPDGSGVYYMTTFVGPQSLGQILGALFIVIFVMKEKSIMFEKWTFRNIITGLVWAAGNICMFISAANPQIGQAVATTLSQLGVIISAFGGVYILHERKTGHQMGMIVIGSILVVIGGVIISRI